MASDQVDQISFKIGQDKNNLTLRIKMAVTKNVLKVKFDCTLCSKIMTILGRHNKQKNNNNDTLEKLPNSILIQTKLSINSLLFIMFLFLGINKLKTQN